MPKKAPLSLDSVPGKYIKKSPEGSKHFTAAQLNQVYPHQNVVQQMPDPSMPYTLYTTNTGSAGGNSSTYTIMATPAASSSGAGDNPNAKLNLRTRCERALRKGTPQMRLVPKATILFPMSGPGTKLLPAPSLGPAGPQAGPSTSFVGPSSNTNFIHYSQSPTQYYGLKSESSTGSQPIAYMTNGTIYEDSHDAHPDCRELIFDKQYKSNSRLQPTHDLHYSVYPPISQSSSTQLVKRISVNDRTSASAPSSLDHALSLQSLYGPKTTPLYYNNTDARESTTSLTYSPAVAYSQSSRLNDANGGYVNLTEQFHPASRVVSLPGRPVGLLSDSSNLSSHEHGYTNLPAIGSNMPLNNKSLVTVRASSNSADALNYLKRISLNESTSTTPNSLQHRMSNESITPTQGTSCQGRHVSCSGRISIIPSVPGSPDQSAGQIFPVTMNSVPTAPKSPNGKGSRVGQNLLVPANPWLTEPIPHWLTVYSQAPLELDRKLKFEMFTVTQLECIQAMLNRLHKQELESIVMAYEKYRIVLQAMIEEKERHVQSHTDRQNAIQMYNGNPYQNARPSSLTATRSSSAGGVESPFHTTNLTIGSNESHRNESSTLQSVNVMEQPSQINHVNIIYRY